MYGVRKRLGRLAAPAAACATLLLGACGERTPDAGPAAGAPRAAGGPLQVESEVFTRRMAAIAERLDPRNDGWRTEALTEDANAVLAKVGQLLADSGSADARARVEGLLDPAFRCGDLWPEGLATVFDDGIIAVSRPADEPEPAERSLTGLEGLVQGLEGLRAPWDDAQEVTTKFKVVGVELEDAASGRLARTSVLFEAHGSGPQTRFEQFADWTCEWRAVGDHVQLVAIDSLPREFVVTRTGGTPLFADCTEAVLGHEPALREQLQYGRDHWSRHIEAVHGMSLYRHCGLAIGDADGDGLDDVYVCQASGLPNRLFLQNADGTLRDVSAAAGVDWLDHTASALLVDLDGDGDQDLALATALGLVLMRNGGAATFERVGTEPVPDPEVSSLTAVDYDEDGDLDLYVTVDIADLAHRDPLRSVEFRYVDNNNGGANRLFRNDTSPEDGWRFTDVTVESGLDVHNRRHSFASAWEDYDGDGDLDVYVANDFGQNCLYRNDDGHFVDVAPELGVVDFGSGMSAAWGDYNRDGRPDLYVANMFSSAGNRVTSQTAFRPGVDEETRALYRRFAKGNTLFEQLPDGTFREATEAGVEMGRWAWGSVFADLNNDGWEDLLVANGYITTEDTGDL